MAINDQKPDYEPGWEDGDEYLVILANGVLFYTGGWESISSLKDNIEWHREIAGSLQAGRQTYRTMRIYSPVALIVDLRGAA